MKTKIETIKSIYFDEEERTHFKAWCIVNNLKIGEAADKLGVSYDYLYSILKGQRKVTDRLVNKFAKIGYRITVLPDDIKKEEARNENRK